MRKTSTPKKIVFRSSVSGRFVKEQYAKRNPKTTERERVDIGNLKIIKKWLGELNMNTQELKEELQELLRILNMIKDEKVRKEIRPPFPIDNAIGKVRKLLDRLEHGN